MILPIIAKLVMEAIRMTVELLHEPFMFSFFLGLFLPQPDGLKKSLVVTWITILLSVLLMNYGGVEFQGNVLGVYFGFNCGLYIPTRLTWIKRLVCLGLFLILYAWIRFHS